MNKKVVIMGAGGRMGRTLIRCLLEKRIEGLELFGAVDLWDDEQLGMDAGQANGCLLYTSPSPRDYAAARMPSSA